MISKLDNLGVLNNYQNSDTSLSTKNKKMKEVAKTTEQNKVDVLKKSIEAGNYKVDIGALAQKVADSLM